MIRDCCPILTGVHLQDVELKWVNLSYAVQFQPFSDAIWATRIISVRLKFQLRLVYLLCRVHGREERSWPNQLHRIGRQTFGWIFWHVWHKQKMRVNSLSFMPLHLHKEGKQMPQSAIKTLRVMWKKYVVQVERESERERESTWTAPFRGCMCAWEGWREIIWAIKSWTVHMDFTLRKMTTNCFSVSVGFTWQMIYSYSVSWGIKTRISKLVQLVSSSQRSSMTWPELHESL